MNIKAKYTPFKKEYCRATLDLSDGDSYTYTKDSDIPTRIEYGRIYSGTFEEGVIQGVFSNENLHNIIYLIKRGYDISEIKETYESKQTI